MTEYLNTIYPFNYDVNKKEIILPVSYPISYITKIKNFSNYNFKFNSNLYFEQMPIKDIGWKNLYAYFYSKKIKFLYRDLNKYIFYMDFFKLNLLINKVKDELKLEFNNLKKENSIHDHFWNYIKIINIINVYSILDCCVVEEMGYFKLQHYCFENNFDLTDFLIDLDSKNFNNYDESIVKLYLDYIKPTKEFCWYFGYDLMNRKNNLISKLEQYTKIKFNRDIINIWIPKISKIIIGKKYDITKD